MILNKYKERLKENAYLVTGVLAGAIGLMPLHEAGHYISDYLQGGNPSFTFDAFGNPATNTTGSIEITKGGAIYDLNKIARTAAGGQIADYLMGGGLAAISKK